ncbi:MAG: hypothetical protein ABR958_05085 [Dehalococcoidales bacterium]
MKMSLNVSDYDSALKDIQAKTLQATQQMTDDIKAGALAWTGLGAAITGALTVSVFAAENAREAQARLAQSMANIGVSYDSVSGQISALVQNEMSLTSYSNNDVYNALNRLVIMTGSYSDAMKALPGVLDLAAAGNMDVTTAARYAADAYDGFSTRLKTMFGIDIPKGVTGMEALEYVFERVKGAAEATANPFTQFKNTVVLLSQDIGGVLLPPVTTVIKNLELIVTDFMDWLNEYPAVKDAFVIIATVAGAAATAIGLTSLAITAQLIPRLVAGATALWSYISVLYAQVAAQVAVYVVMGPAGWAILAGMAAATVLAGVAVKDLIGNLTNEATAANNANAAIQNLGSSSPAAFTGMETAAEISIKNITWGLEQLGADADTIHQKLVDLGLAAPTTETPGTPASSPSSQSWWDGFVAYLKKQFVTESYLPQGTTYDTGGLITEPTLLTRLSTMQPYAVAAANGQPERISPAGTGGNITQHFHIAQLTVRDESDVNKIAKQLYYLQKTKARVLGVT